MIYGYKVVYGCGHVFYSQTPHIAIPCPKCGYLTCTVYVWDKQAPEDAEVIAVNQLRFQAQISRMADRYVINIPKALALELTPYLNKTITVTLEM
jgi:hypothetical protein